MRIPLIYFILSVFFRAAHLPVQIYQRRIQGPLKGRKVKFWKPFRLPPFASKPGGKFSYSNIGYGILGLALSKAAKKPFIELIEKRIFEPLNMTSSYFVVPKEKLSALSTGIQDADGEVDTKTPLLEHKGRGYKVPNGGIYSTSNDLAKFMIGNLRASSNLVSSENLAVMQNEITSIGEQHYYGLGFFVSKRDQLTI